jgi:hypothetical protein
VGEGTDAYSKIQRSIQNQLAAHGEILSREREKLDSAVARTESLCKDWQLIEFF